MSYITEAQAREKWCPHAVASHTDPRAGFRDDGRPIVHPCIASSCMAWLFVDIEPSEKAKVARIQRPEEDRLAVLNEGEPKRPADLPPGYEWVPLTGYTGDGDDPDVDGAFWQESEASRAARVAELYAKRRGYCGLVGGLK